MKPNISRTDALCRITIGFTMLASSTAKLVKHPMSPGQLVCAMMGGMKVAEGITQYCPLTHLVEQKMQHMEMHGDCNHDHATNPS